jgi:hypothetical protein
LLHELPAQLEALFIYDESVLRLSERDVHVTYVVQAQAQAACQLPPLRRLLHQRPAQREALFIYGKSALQLSARLVHLTDLVQAHGHVVQPIRPSGACYTSHRRSARFSS